MAEPYNAQRPPKVGSKLLMRTAPGHPPQEAVLAGYLPGRVRGQPLKGPRSHKNILISVRGASLKSDTSQIHMVVWRAPTRKPPAKKPGRPKGAKAKQPLTPKTQGEWSEIGPLDGLRQMDPLEAWDAAWEDASGEVPARWAPEGSLLRIERPYPGVHAIARMADAFYRRNR